MKKALSLPLSALLLCQLALSPAAAASVSVPVLKPFDKVYSFFPEAYGDPDAVIVLAESQYTAGDIPTYCFETITVFEGAEDVAADVLEAGKNPGLGVRALHAQGITGEGVNVAIIDQNLLTDHPEFSEKIVAYYDAGCETPADMGSFHAPSVVSLLAGDSMGTAPGVRIYYAATPSWKQDAAHSADCLRWIIAQNEALPQGEKIRLVSVSSSPEDGWYANAEQWAAAVEEAAQAGILVMDCRSRADTGFVFSAFYDREDPDDVTKCKPGYPNVEYDDFSDEYWKDTIFAPASYRTMARESVAGVFLYGYDGLGGQSWAVPYVAGVLALGFQVRPDLSAEEMKSMLFASCWIDADGVRIIDPPRFIETLRGAPPQ